MSMVMNPPFVTTGYEKSGTSWFEAMLWSLDGVGGYAPDASAGMPLTAQWLLHDPELRATLTGFGLTAARTLELLLAPGGMATPGPIIPPERESELRAALVPLLARCRRMKDNFDPSRTHELLSMARLAAPLLGRAWTHPSRTTLAFGCPSKHVPTSELRYELPGWRIVRILRDPRDILVSRFYHALAHIARDIDDFADLSQPDPVLRPDWQARFFAKHARAMMDWFDKCSPREARDVPDDERGCTQVIVRYEDLLADAPRELARVAYFLGLPREPANLRDVCQRLSFASLTGGDGERRNSFIRKGQAGDWRNYFSRSLALALGPSFTDLLVDLGYETSNEHNGEPDWIATLPEHAPCAFDFSRFRIRRAAAHRFLPLWQSRADLQERFPMPLDVRSHGSFADWLAGQNDPEICRWLHVTTRLAEMWNAEVEETAFH
ncbi:MAG: sulfotransferase domain-containing protein [Phycisphaerales bacterium]|nr:sulfotransferase domain-containing protein [Phycisphaerales bacterium]